MFDGLSAGGCCVLNHRVASNDDDAEREEEEEEEERVFCVGWNYCFKRTVINGQFSQSFPVYC